MPGNKASFLTRNGGLDGLSGSVLEYKTIHKPFHGLYIPFSDGESAYVGKKFVQAECVAVLAVLFRQQRVSLGQLRGECRQDARGRVGRALGGCWAPLTPGMMPEEVPLVFGVTGESATGR
ncbi:uncharacterized protein DSM5745_03931 [Aspergillus mulundensis]|uniref:Uncharacterized protein n=1 Tax=Aspergillus mulundensis TaxID=1810919 RepID=A0A3D8SB99_9EURO|nr:hypothetical protein DSM5745_03931 [Aspergillus mulundensis]RDW83605.1 hypothetical protein DSM5745_03931 [Aspergillus mulundensis]